MANVELTVEANLAGLRKQLESIPGLTAEQAKAMASELNKSFKASERAAKQAADATKKAMDSAASSTGAAARQAGDLGDKFGKVGGDAGKLAGALDMVGPGLGDAVRGIGDLADVGEVAAGSLGVLAGPVLAGLAAAALIIGPPLAVMAAEMEREAEAARVAAEANAFVTEQLEAQKIALDAAALANGAMTQSAYDEAAARRNASSELGGYLTKLNEEVTAIEQSEVKHQALINEITRYANMLISTNQLVAVFNKLTGASVPTLSELANTASKAVGFTGKLADAEKNAGAATSAATAAVKARRDAEIEAIRAKARSAAASRASAEASKKLTEEQKKETDRVKELASFIAELDKVKGDDATESEKLAREIDRLTFKAIDLTGSSEVAADAIGVLEKRMQTLRDVDAAKALEKQAAAAKALKDQYEELIPPEQVTELEKLSQFAKQADQAFLDGTITLEQYDTMLQGIAKRSKELGDATGKMFNWDRIAAFMDKVKKYSDNLFNDLNTISDFYQERANTKLQDAIKARKALGDDATEEEKAQAKKRVKDAREAAREQFKITQALQVAQIIVNTAASASAAMVAPPPFSFIAAAAAIAAGGVQLATVAATRPKFHKGGLIGQPDEQTAIVRNGEAVLNPMARKALGDENIRDLNAGMGLAGTGGAVQIVYKHKAFDYFVREHLKTNATLPRALQSGRRLGHKGG